jgi:hypothetical protein
MQLSDFKLSDTRQNIQFEANASIQDITSTPSISVNDLQLKISKTIQQFISKNIRGE